MADVFEERPELDPWRAKLWSLIEQTPQLDWLLLTKRPQLVAEMVPWAKRWPANVWLGTTVEDQASAEERLPHLSKLAAVVRFVSAEPLLGEVDLRDWMGTTINWVITGGESGPKARPSNPTWFRELLQQCAKAHVPFHFKQWGDWVPVRKSRNASREKVATQTFDDGTTMHRVGKKAAGRLLDGEMWDGLPKARAA